MSLPDIAALTEQDSRDGVQQTLVGAVIDHNGQILLIRRRPGDSRGGEWELRAGKVEPGEDLLAALHREVAEETGLTITGLTHYLGAFDYRSRSDRHNRQHTWSVTVTAANDVRLTEHDAFTWAGADDDRPVGPELAVVINRHFQDEPAGLPDQTSLRNSRAAD